MSGSPRSRRRNHGGASSSPATHGKPTTSTGPTTPLTAGRSGRTCRTPNSWLPSYRADAGRWPARREWSRTGNAGGQIGGSERPRAGGGATTPPPDWAGRRNTCRRSQHTSHSRVDPGTRTRVVPVLRCSCSARADKERETLPGHSAARRAPPASSRRPVRAASALCSRGIRSWALPSRFVGRRR